MAVGIVGGIDMHPKPKKKNAAIGADGHNLEVTPVSLFDPTPKDLPMAVPTSADQQNIEEEFQDQDLKVEEIDVKIRFVNGAEIGGANLQVRATLEVIEIWVSKERVFTSMALREVIGGVLQNRLHRLNNRFLAKKAKQELMR